MASQNNNGLSWTYGTIERVKFQRTDYIGGESAVWLGDEATKLVQKSGLFGQPDQAGETLGLVTGNLVVEMQSGEVHKFELLGEAVLEMPGTDFAFFATPEFLDTIPAYNLKI